MNDELIDKKKISDLSKEFVLSANDDYRNIKEITRGLRTEELILLYGLSYVRMINSLYEMPPDVLNSFCHSMNTKCQQIARDLKMLLEENKHRISLIIPTEDMRVSLNHALNANDEHTALTLACKLLDIYVTGQEEPIYSLMLEKGRRNN